MNTAEPSPRPLQPLLEPRTRTNQAPQKVQFEVTQSTLIRLTLLLAALWLVVRLWPVILVFIVALFVMETLNPAVQWLEAHRVRRGVGIAVIFVGVFLLAVLILTLTIPAIVAQAAALFEREPTFRAGFADQLSHYRLSAPFADWLRNLRYGAPGNALGATALAYSMRLFEITAYGLSAMFLSLYMMIDLERLRGGLYALVPRTQHIRLSRIMLNVETIIGAYIRGQLITCLLIGIFTFILLTACGIENALALATFAAIADVLPYVGAILSTVPVVIAALGHGTTTTIIVLVAMLAYEEFESRILVPRIYGKALRLPSSVVFLALMAGSTLMGLLGALLALPVAATVMMLIEELRVDLPGEQEQAADALLRARDDLEEEEYARRTEGATAEQAAAIAVEISVERRNEALRTDAPP